MNQNTSVAAENVDLIAIFIFDLGFVLDTPVCSAEVTNPCTPVFDG
jgi:hypothetical protein